MQRIINKGILSNDYEITVYLNEYQKELEDKAEKAKQARENKKAENKAKKESKAAWVYI